MAAKFFKRTESQSASHDRVDVRVGLSRNTMIACWLFVGVFALGAVLFVGWHHQLSQQRTIEAANQHIVEATEFAKEWLAVNSSRGGEAVEKDLADAIQDKDATEKRDGNSVLNQVRQRREEFAEQKRVERAQQQATTLFNDAKEHLERKLWTDAVSMLEKYTNNPHATEKIAAQQLLIEIPNAVSDSMILNALMELSTEGFERVRSSGQIDDGKVTYPVLLDVRKETIKRNLPEAAQRREEIRVAREKALVAERLAREKKREAERLASEKKRETIDVISLDQMLGIHEYPSQYRGRFIRFDAHVDHSRVNRHKETAGYIFDYDWKGRHSMGNEFGLLPDKLNYWMPTVAYQTLPLGEDNVEIIVRIDRLSNGQYLARMVQLRSYERSWGGALKLKWKDDGFTDPSHVDASLDNIIIKTGPQLYEVSYRPNEFLNKLLIIPVTTSVYINDIVENKTLSPPTKRMGNEPGRYIEIFLGSKRAGGRANFLGPHFDTSQEIVYWMPEAALKKLLQSFDPPNDTDVFFNLHPSAIMIYVHTKQERNSISDNGKLFYSAGACGELVGVFNGQGEAIWKHPVYRARVTLGERLLRELQRQASRRTVGP